MVSRDKPIILVSGGFDPLHDGHLLMLEAASLFGDVVVALNSDEWLIRKKGRAFMPFDIRKKILLAIKYVYHVVEVDDRDGTICQALREVKPQYFGNGGDRIMPNHSEKRYCELHGIEQIFGLGGRKTNSSSELIKRALK